MPTEALLSPPLLPESAPFTPAQRAWLNGFFAGLIGLEPAKGAPAAVAPAATLAPPSEEYPWHDPSLPLDERLRLAEGKPLALRLMAAMAQLDCGACGYQCRTYGEAIAGGAEKSLTLCAPGGKATATKVKELVAASRAAAGGAPAPTAAAPPSRPNGFDRQRPFAARFVRSVRLNREGSIKDTRQVVIDLEGSGLTYEPGDSLGVFPENCPDLVQAILRALGASGDAEVAVPAGGTVSLEAALARHCALDQATEELLELLGPLPGLAGGAGDDLHLIDLLPALEARRLDAAGLVAALGPLRPRLYSIASSLRAHPDEVHLTVGVVRYEAHGRLRKGVASTYLGERLREGGKVRVFVQGASSFRLPASLDAPIVMIGPGTGIAPFRAFLQERRALGARGKAWLFFGDQRRESDFLYREELEGHLRDGSLTQLDTAFSRDQEAKVYVQHRLLERSRTLWAWIEEGAHLYVCGDARRMARDVDDALRAILEREGALSREAAAQRLRDLGAAGRYHRDVY